jgi:aminoglycoside phosphotransferase (APT) family kinase protein
VLPSEQRLLAGIRDALKAAIAADPASKAVGLIAAATVGVDELIVRADSAFWSAYHQRGMQLIDAGQALARQLGRADTSEDLPTRAVVASPSAASPAAQMDDLLVALTRLVHVLGTDAASSAAVSGYLSEVVDWENELHAHRLHQASQSRPSDETAGSAFTREAMQSYLRSQRPEWGDVIITDLKKLPGGFSKTTVVVDFAGDQAGQRSIVIRAEQAVTLLFFDGARIENEYRVLGLLHRAGRRVPAPLWLESDTRHFGVKFLVSEKAEGRNVGTAISVNEDIPGPLLADLIGNLVTVHRTPIDAADPNVACSHLARWGQYRTLTESTRANVEYWREQVELMGLPASPIIRRTLDWLANHVPEANDAPSLIHRDYGLHNILVTGDRLSCILDWEGATLGDPAEDLAWMTDSMRAKVDRQRILDLYAQTSGAVVPESRLRFFDVFTSLKYAVTCLQALALFEKSRAVPIVACQLGLLYPYHGTAGLNSHLKAAESVR